MKNDNFAYPYNDYREPDWHEGPHHPHKDGVHHKHWRPWNDTEPAANWEPWCPPHPIDDCICVTQNDVERWNSVSAISEIKDLPWDDIKSLSGMAIGTSADYWNSTYETLNTNSATWAKQTQVDNIEDEVKANFDVVTSAIYDLSAKAWNLSVDNKSDQPYVLCGNGKPDWPLRLSDHVIELLYYVEHGKVIDTKWQLDHEIGASVVPVNDGPFMLKDTFYAYSGTVDNLNNKFLTQAASLSALSDTVEDIIDLLSQYSSRKEDFWKNEKVSIEESTKNKQYFYYWDSLKV